MTKREDIGEELAEIQDNLIGLVSKATKLVRSLPRSDMARKRAEAYWVSQLKTIVQGRGDDDYPVTDITLDSTIKELTGEEDED